MQNKKLFVTILFCVIEAILYYFILTAGGEVQRYCSFISVLLCFLFSLLMGRRQQSLIVAGLACTMGADFCLVLCTPIEQLAGMAFFLGAQIHYAALLYKRKNSVPLLWVRIGLCVLIVTIAAFVLKDKLDALAIISVAYYANLIMNIVVAFTQWRKCKLLPIAFVLFLLCDTVIGLQVASGGYLPISEGSWLYTLLFMPFNLSWFFYLPSQVLIALSSAQKGE